MHYMKEIDEWLEASLGEALDPEALEAFGKEVKARLLQSYRNGQDTPKRLKKSQPKD